MPHFIIEYSANLDSQIDVPGLVETVHKAALETGIFPLKGTRTRAARREEYCIADGDASNAFVHVSSHIGRGRSAEVRRIAAESIYDAICEFLRPYFDEHPLALSFDMQEINPETSFKFNNLPDWIARRSKGEMA